MLFTAIKLMKKSKQTSAAKAAQGVVSQLKKRLCFARLRFENLLTPSRYFSELKDLSLDQWFLTCGEFPTSGEWGVAKWGMIYRREKHGIEI